MFDRSIHLRAGETFVCIGGPEIGNGPLTLIADSFRPSQRDLRAGQPAFVTEQRITIGERVVLSLEHCEPWRPATWPIASSPARLADTLEILNRTAALEAPPEGLARPVLCRHEGGGSWPRTARDRVAGFERWLSALLATDGAAAAPPDAVHRLIGLGPGLTPAGDDFLIGVLALLDALAEKDLHAALAGVLRQASPQSTSSLSHCFLRAAAAGHVGEHLHRAVSSVISGEADAAVAAARQIGHSSGWDMLTGVAVALRIVAPAQRTCSNSPTVTAADTHRAIEAVCRIESAKLIAGLDAAWCATSAWPRSWRRTRWSPRSSAGRERHPRQPGRLADGDRQASRDRPVPPQPAARREARRDRPRAGGGAARRPDLDAALDDDDRRRPAAARVHRLPPGAVDARRASPSRCGCSAA